MQRNDTMWRMNQERHVSLLEVARAHRLSKTSEVTELESENPRPTNVNSLLASFRLWLRTRNESVAQ
jgi:hypothetical protein